MSTPITTVTFNSAIAPRLAQIVREWHTTQLSFTEQSTLARHFKACALSAFNKSGAPAKLGQSLLTMVTAEMTFSQMSEKLIELFLISSAQYNALDLASSVPLRVSSYVARMGAFLQRLQRCIAPRMEPTVPAKAARVLYRAATV